MPITMKTTSPKEQLHLSVRYALDQYFTSLDGGEAHNLYEMLIAEVERPLIEAVMLQAGQNQCKAAQWLGISRNTLRKLLVKYSDN